MQYYIWPSDFFPLIHLEGLVIESSRVLNHLRKSSKYTFEILITKLNDFEIRKNRFNKLLNTVGEESARLQIKVGASIS